MKRFLLSIISFFTQIFLFAQTQYDYMDDDAVAGGADKALNSIVIIFVLIVIAFVLLFVLGGLLNVYYWFNPKADPSYKREVVNKERERKHQEILLEQEKRQEEYIQKQRNNAVPEAIDLGLSVKWASFNLGAYKQTDIGCTFYWAENQPNNPQYRNIDVDLIGDIAGDERYDAATNLLGENWRLPTVDECRELLEKCKWETKIIDGVEGRLVFGPNGHCIFLPIEKKSITEYVSNYEYVNSHISNVTKKVTKIISSGHYWTSSPNFKWNCVYYIIFGNDEKYQAEILYARTSNEKFCIRPVFTTITREMFEKQRQLEIEKAYAQILSKDLSPIDSYDCKYYQEQCELCENENSQTDEYGVIYSLDGKRLLNGSNCNCRITAVRRKFPEHALID